VLNGKLPILPLHRTAHKFALGGWTDIDSDLRALSKSKARFLKKPDSINMQNHLNMEKKDDIDKQKTNFKHW